MTAAVLVAAVAGIELFSWWLKGRTWLAVVAAWLAMVTVGAGVGGAIAGWGAAAVAAGAAAWLVLRSRVGADLAMGALVTWTAVLLLVDGDPSRRAAITAAFGLIVLLARTSNEVCRDVIERARFSPPQAVVVDDAVEPRAEAAPPAEEQPRLKGGRFIGPLERWLIVALALVGAEAVVVGLMAAKGIGRFPEISGDKARGANAEEFLVGSLVSWALAGAAALMLAVLRA